MSPTVTVSVNIDTKQTEPKELKDVSTKAVTDPTIDALAKRLTEGGGDISLFDYAQWLNMRIKNLLGNAPIEIKEATISSGKFYNEDKDKSLLPSQVDGTVIAPGQIVTVSACGKKGAWVGTEGKISLYEGSTRICVFSWDCPFWSSKNSFNATSVHPSYNVTVGDWNQTGGAIGNVYLEVERLD
ncbi:Aegerolysin-domain-containing protein [Phlebopus sp. FC_14]|nr:Aegerolysin-domain-containing protein [Phlebopus sp. FC_14]